MTISLADKYRRGCRFGSVPRNFSFINLCLSLLRRTTAQWKARSSLQSTRFSATVNVLMTLRFMSAEQKPESINLEVLGLDILTAALLMLRDPKFPEFNFNFNCTLTGARSHVQGHRHTHQEVCDACGL
jgi:hypothetical protein